MTRMYDDNVYNNLFMFDNGYGLSVISKPGSWGHKRGQFEVAVMHETTFDSQPHVCNRRLIVDGTDNVFGWCEFNDVAEYMDIVKAWEPAFRCDHDNASLYPLHEHDTKGDG